MKSIFFLLTFLLLSQVANAQFKTYKNHYKTKYYTYLNTDKYNPRVAAVLAIIPGAGHVYSGHYWRGLIFPVGMLGSGFLVMAGSLENWADGWDSDPLDGGKGKMIIGQIAFLGFYALNFVDAVRVAKIKNLHFRPQQVTFKVKPYCNKYIYINHIGVTFEITI